MFPFKVVVTLEASLCDSTEMLSEAQRETALNKENLESTEAFASRLETDLATAKSREQNLRDTVATRENEKLQLESRTHSLELLLDSLQNSLAESKRRETLLEKQVKRLEAKERKTQSKIVNLETSLQTSLEDRSNLNETVEAMQNDAAERERLGELVESLRNSQAESKMREDTLHQRLLKLESDASVMSGLVSTLEQRLSESQLRELSLQTELSVLVVENSQLGPLSELVAKLKGVVSALEEDLAESKQKLTLLQEELAFRDSGVREAKVQKKHELQISTLEKRLLENERLSSQQILELEDLVRNLESNLALSEQKVVEIHTKSQDEIKKLSSNVKRQQAHIDGLESLVAELERSLDESKVGMTSMLKDSFSSSQLSEENQSRVGMLEERISVLENVADDREAVVTVLEKNMAQERIRSAEREATVATLEMRVSVLEAELSDKDAAATAMKLKLGQASLKINLLMSQIAELKSGSRQTSNPSFDTENLRTELQQAQQTVHNLVGHICFVEATMQQAVRSLVVADNRMVGLRNGLYQRISGTNEAWESERKLLHTQTVLSRNLEKFEEDPAEEAQVARIQVAVFAIRERDALANSEKEREMQFSI